MPKCQQRLTPWTQGLSERQDKGMTTHICIKATGMFTMEVMKAALEHPLITAKYPAGKVWRYADVHANDIAAEVTLRRSGEEFDINAHCEVEYDGTLHRGIGDIVIGQDMWDFTASVTEGELTVTVMGATR